MHVNKALLENWLLYAMNLSSNAPFFTHGDYSTAGPNGEAIRTNDPAKDEFNSDHFSGEHNGNGNGDKQGIEHDAAGKPEYRGYLGTPSGKFLVYNPNTGVESELK